MKKTIRMNERELHHLIAESVKRVLNENPTYDMQGNYIDDEFEDYDDDDIDYSKTPEDFALANYLCNQIMKGNYDDNIFDDDWADNIANTVRGDEVFNWVYDAIADRRCIINPQYAFKHGKDDTTYNKYTTYMETQYPLDFNDNIDDNHKFITNLTLGRTRRKSPFIERGWNDMKQDRQKDKNNPKDKTWQKAAKTRQLHRKNSNNRLIP